jgi:hypothetical protein
MKQSRKQSRKQKKSRRAKKRSHSRRRQQAGGDGSTALLAGDYPVTAKLPSGEIGDPDSIPTVIPKELYDSLRGAADDEVPPSL